MAPPRTMRLAGRMPPNFSTRVLSLGAGCSEERLQRMRAWIADWILSTRPDSIGTVTAGTFTQLESRTWSAIQHWTKLCITGHWFNIQARGWPTDNGIVELLRDHGVCYAVKS